MLLNTLFSVGERIDQVLTRKQPAAPKRPSHLGKLSKAYGPNLETFTLQYAVVELDSLISSDNGLFPSELQPRDRSRIASNMQVNSIAKNLNPLGLLEEFKSLDRGAPIISDNLVVLSGNGRIMALRQSQKYGLYAAQLALVAPKFGITQKANYLRKPVLVRVLRDNTNLVDFCKIANGAGIMAQAVTETAMSDISIKVNTGDLDYNFVVGQFLAGLPQNDRAALVDSRGELNKAGKARFESALFYQVYGSKKLLELSQETIDPDCKNLIGAMVEMLLPLAQLEQSIKNGEKFDTCRFASEFSLVANKFIGLKSDGIKIKTYLDQPALFEDLTDNQKMLLAELDNAKSKKQIVAIIQSWIDLASETPHPSQVGMFGEVEAPQLWDRFFNKLAA